MATAVEQALQEIVTKMAIVAPQHEGLRDYSRLNISPETRTEVTAAITVYDRRVTVMLAAKNALTALLADGYPDLDIREVSAAVLADLKENAATIEAALAQFGSNQAAAIVSTAGPAEPKR